MIKKTLVLVLVPAFLVGSLTNAGFGWLSSSQQSPSSEKGVGKVIEKKDEEPVEPEPPEEPVYDPPMESMCGDVNTTSAGAESALFTHMAGMASYARHDTMLHAAVRIPLMFDTRDGATANYRTTPQLGMSTMADPDGRSRVALQFHIKTIDATVGLAVFKPSALQFSHDYSAHYVYSDGNGTLRQLLTDDTLTDITLLGAGEEGYLIRSYRRADQVGAFDPNALPVGIYPVTGQPYLESKVYNPNPFTYNGNIKVRVTERFNSGPDVVKINSWSMNPTSNSTTFEEQYSDSTGAFYPVRKTVLTRTALSGEDYWQTREKLEPLTPVSTGFTGAPSLSEVSRDYEKYTFIGGEKRLVQLKTAVTGTGANTSETITTDYTYYAPSSNGYNTGRPDTVVRSDGMWWKYQYSHNYSSGLRVFKTYTPFGNTSIGNYQQGKLESVFVSGDSYTKLVIVDGQEVSKEVQTSSIVNNKLVIKTERGHNTPGGPLVSYAAFNRDSSQNLTENRMHSRLNEDGTVEHYSYVDLGNGDGSYSETIQSGAGAYDSNGLVTSVTSGTEITTLYNANGMAYEYSSKDISSGLDLGSWSAIEPGSGPNAGTLHVDDFGRPTKKFYNGIPEDFAAWEHSCCGYEEVTSRTGAIATYERDLLKRNVSVVRKNSVAGVPIETTTRYEGLTTTVEQNANGTTLLLSETTESFGGLTTTNWTPDADGKASSVASTAPAAYPNAEFNQRDVAFNSAGQGATTIVTYPDGSTTNTLTYSDGTFHSITNQAGQETAFEYGTHNEQGGGIWTKEVSPVTTLWTKKFEDSLGRVIKVEYADASIETNSYHGAAASPGSRGKLATEKDADEVEAQGTGVEVSYSYSAKGELLSVSALIANGHSSTVTVVRDVVPSATIKGVVIAPAIRTTRSNNGTVLEAIYGSKDGYLQGTDSLMGTTLTVQTVPVDGVWEVARESEYGQVLVEAYADGRLSNVAHFDNNQPVGGYVHGTQTTYDAFGRVLQVTDSRTGAETITGRRNNGVVVGMSLAGGSETIAYEHDSMGRLTATILADGSKKQSSYTPTGQVAATWGSQEYAKLYQYNALGKLAEMRTYKSIAYGVEPTAATGGSAQTDWIYDAYRGWLLEKNYDGESGDGPGGQQDYTYTAAGRLKTRTWERGVITTYSYDRGYVEKVEYSDDTPDLEFEYDSFGRHVTADQAGNRHTYSYDGADLTLSAETVVYDTNGDGIPGVGDFSRTIDRSYGPDLRESGYGLLEGSNLESLVFYDYDKAGRIHSVRDKENGAAWEFTYGYVTNSKGLVENLLGPVHTVQNSYEPNRDVLDWKENSTVGAGATLISKYDYSVNKIYQRESLTTQGAAFTSAPSFTWKYNQRGELEEAKDTTPSALNHRAYQYDGIGNREKSVDGLIADLPATNNYMANLKNQYTTIGALNPGYDLDGNPTSYPVPAAAPGQSATLSWDGENRLKDVTIGGITTTYSYDYVGRRIAKKVGNSTPIYYVYDGWNLIGEYSGAGQAVDRTYVWGLDLDSSRRNLGGVGGLLAVHTATGIFYPTYDGNGSVSEYLDSGGSIAAHRELDAFGRTTTETSAVGAPSFAHWFSTKCEDVESGLYYYGFRYYEPESGRFCGRDPINESGGSNVYGFVANDPIGSIDYLGMLCWISVRYNKVFGWGPFKFYHGYVVTHDTGSGEETVFRAGPANGDSGLVSGGSGQGSSNTSGTNGTNSSGGPAIDPTISPGVPTCPQCGTQQTGTGTFGNVVGVAQPFKNNKDYRPGSKNPGVPDKWGDSYVFPFSCKCINLAMLATIRRINAAGIPYKPFKENSNSFAHQVIEDLGLPRPSAPRHSPGHGRQL